MRPLSSFLAGALAGGAVIGMVWAARADGPASEAGQMSTK
jgi:hypothetical protein